MRMNYHHSKVKHQMERRFMWYFPYRKQDKCKLFIDKLSWFSANVVNKQGKEVWRFEGTQFQEPSFLHRVQSPYRIQSLIFFLSGTFYWWFTTKCWELSLCCRFSSEQVRDKHVPHLLEMTSDDVFQVNINHINNDFLKSLTTCQADPLLQREKPHPILNILLVLELPEWERRAQTAEGLSRKIFLIQTTVSMGVAQCYTMLIKPWS